MTDAMSKPDESELLVRDHHGVRMLTLNRPNKRNAMNYTLTLALVNALEDADENHDVGAILITGAGPAFCAGADLNEFKELTGDNVELVTERARLTTLLHSLFPKLEKPVICAVNGAAMGGGAGLALAGDIVMAAASAKFGYPEVKHGIVAAIVMTNLVRQVGRKTAFELVATGQTITAGRALELGMINHVLPDHELLVSALAMAESLAAVKRPAMAATKRLFYEVCELPFDEALERGKHANAAMRGFGAA